MTFLLFSLPYLGKIPKLTNISCWWFFNHHLCWFWFRYCIYIYIRIYTIYDIYIYVPNNKTEFFSNNQTFANLSIKVVGGFPNIPKWIAPYFFTDLDPWHLIQIFEQLRGSWMARALALLKTLMAQVSWLGSIGIYFSFEYLGFVGSSHENSDGYCIFRSAGSCVLMATVKFSRNNPLEGKPMGFHKPWS